MYERRPPSNERRCGTAARPRRLRAPTLVLLLASTGVWRVAAASALAPETIAVHPAGLVTWTALIDHELAAPRDGRPTQPKAVPFMPMPWRRREISVSGRGMAEPAAPAGTAPRGMSRAPASPAAASLPRAVSVTTGFPALQDDNSGIPPDTMGAAGPEHLVTMLNTQVRIHTKAGATLGTVSLTTFWTGGTGLVGDPFDPRVIYDPGSERWIATVDANGKSATSRVWFAISSTSDPTGSWTFFGFTADPTGNTWADFPGFGVNSTWIAITQNMFTVASDPAFQGTKMWVIDKATALAGGPLTVTVFPTDFDVAGGFGGFALQPALTFGPAPKLYIVDSSGFVTVPGGINLLRMSEISGTGPSPTWSITPGSPFAGSGLFAVANPFDSPIGAEQLGVPSTCAGGPSNGSACTASLDCDPDAGGRCRRVDTGDIRISGNAVGRNGRIWVTHAGGLPVDAVDRTAVFWYQLDPASMVSSGAPIVQSGVIDGGAGAHHFYPSIAANALDDVCVGFSRSDASRFVEAVATGRRGTGSSGQMDPITVLKAGEDSYFKTFSGTDNRWGDYSATVVDPADDVTFWTIQQYAATDVGVGPTDDRWGTWWAEKRGLAEPDELMPGQVLLVKGGSLVKFAAKPPAGSRFALPALGDPTVDGGTLEIFDIGGSGSVTFGLPVQPAPFGWRGLGKPPGVVGFRYRGTGTPGDPCKAVLVREKVIKGLCRGSAVDLAVPFPGDRGVILAVGGTVKRYCAEFGGTAVGNPEVSYKRRKAPAPEACPTSALECPPAFPVPCNGQCWVCEPGFDLCCPDTGDPQLCCGPGGSCNATTGECE